MAIVWKAPATCPACGGGNLLELEYCAGYRCMDCAKPPDLVSAAAILAREDAALAVLGEQHRRDMADQLMADVEAARARIAALMEAQAEGCVRAEPYAGNAVCKDCGGPAHVSLLSMECLREGGCAVPEEPMPKYVQLRPRNGPRDEVLWQASGRDQHVLHPTREGAIAAWRAKVSR